MFSFGLIGLLCLALWIFALVDIVNSRFRQDTTKIVWALVVIFIPFIGTILY
ncbi:PLDc N-terminal domain-containing protein [Paraflavitalea sp. CAU 1676]|uniref:PLDc N-terminal domain-containing protein n=1 Tax=Paraflavitalea sp. CAU 1676 TaxID=3032598 RepID=UPI0023DC6121|nr:PLDc N-terminal domain-containing protein [Paraflavitalea sp. CAU 1676]MDF2187675.1 PLDc N-terminal domain-containing protein [Paraflavitalea sp. CAU 1676]